MFMMASTLSSKYQKIVQNNVDPGEQDLSTEASKEKKKKFWFSKRHPAQQSVTQ